jgi:hypothetical protein
VGIVDGGEAVEGREALLAGAVAERLCEGDVG